MVSAHTGNSFRNSLESHKGGGKHKTTPKHSPRYAYAKLFLATIAALDPSITFHVIMKIKNNYIETNERRRYGVSSSAVQLCVCGQHLYAQCVYTNGLDMFG